MSRLDSIRTKIQKKIFDGIGSDCTLERVNTKSIDKWGDASITYLAGTTVRIVPYNLIDHRDNFQPFGDLSENETDAVIPYDTVFDKGDKITLLGTEYDITEIEEFQFQGGNLAFAIRLAKIQ